MAHSWQTETGTAGQVTVTVNIPYLSQDDISVYVNNVAVNFSWDSALIIRLATALTGGEEVLVLRKTNRQTLRVLFSEGAGFTRENLDEQNKQFLYLAQELVEGRSFDGFYGDLSMHEWRLTDLGDPVNSGDATNKGYVDSANAVQDSRLSNLEQTFDNGGYTASYPVYTEFTAASNTFTPGRVFTKAQLFVDGVPQAINHGFTISNNVITFVETLPAGTIVSGTIGEDILPDNGMASAAQLTAAIDKVNSSMSAVQTELANDITAVETRTTALETSVGGIGTVLAQAGSVTALSTNGSTNLASITLTAGDWDIRGVAQFTASDGSMTSIKVSASATSGSLPGFPYRSQLNLAFPAGDQHITAPSVRIQVTKDTPIYLVASATFGSGTVSASGFISARRAI